MRRNKKKAIFCNNICPNETVRCLRLGLRVSIEGSSSEQEIKGDNGGLAHILTVGN